MLKVKKSITIAQDPDKYLSFPDIMQDEKNPDKFFIVYREGNAHHPTVSKLVLMVSKDGGEKWRIRSEFPLTMKKDGYVWNCPRLSYIDNILYIVCDQKSSVFERRARFKTVTLTSTTKGHFVRLNNTDMPGMVPDKIVRFKDKLVCANHKIKSINNDLIQLISWSRDNGRTWYDTNIMANDSVRQYCEASVVNLGDNLIAYLRDNSGHKRNIYTTISDDGVYWEEPERLSIFGQRVTAIREEDKVIGAYRNTENCNVSIFEHNLISNQIKSYDIDWEYPKNQYHFGYTGIAKIEKDKYLVVYYIKQDTENPFIKLASVEREK